MQALKEMVKQLNMGMTNLYDKDVKKHLLNYISLMQREIKLNYPLLNNNS